MRRFILWFLMSVLGLCGFMRLALADTGPYHYNRVTRTATTVSTANTYTASAWVEIVGSKLDCKKIMIAEDSRSLDLLIAFSQEDIDNSTYWIQKPGDGIFDQPVRTNPSFGMQVNTTITSGGLNTKIRFFGNN